MLGAATVPAVADPGEVEPESAGPAAAESVHYGAFRVVRNAPAAPSTPEITLPPGYELVPGANYQAASRSEYYAYVRGPVEAAVQVSVRWPDQWISDVVSGKSRLPITRDPADPARISFPLPVTMTGPSQGTLQVWSYPSPDPATGLHWRIEHNDPNRAAGYWANVTWPANQAAAAINYLVACAAILQDSGLVDRARQRGHFFSLMGFETNNLLHLDNPPHWHLAYYPGPNYGAPRAHVPHFWMDANGRTFYNGMDIQGQGRSRFYAGDPAQIHDAEGNLIVTLTIRADGGLDVIPPDGSVYSITSADGNFSHRLTVLRNGAPWRFVQTFDRVTTGVLVSQVGSIDDNTFNQTLVYQYDPLTGVITQVRQLTPVQQLLPTPVAPRS